MNLDWFWRLFDGFGKIPKVPESVDEAKVDNKVRKTKQPNRRKVSTGKSDKSAKSTGVRGNNKSKTTGQRKGTAVRTAASKSKAKSKTV